MSSRLKYLPIALILFLVGFFLTRGCDKRIDKNTASTVLNPGIVEKVIVNPDTHQLTIITPTRTDTLFLPDRPSSIEVSEKGTVNVTSKQFGTEIKPFGGLGYADKFRLYGGVDGVYFKKWDGGLFVSGTLNAPIRVGLAVSYTIHSNTRITFGLDNAKNPNFLLSVRL